MVVQKLKNLVSSFSREDDIFRAREIQQSELPWIRTRHIWTGTLGNIYGTFLGPTGIYFTFFCFSSGMSRYQLGIMASLILFTVVSQIFSWIFEDICGNRKYPWYIFSLISRLCFVPIVFSFWIPIGPLSIITLCVISSVFANLAAPPWSSWLYDMIPEKQLVSFMARRSAVIQLFLMGLALFAALAVQQSDQAHKLVIVRLVFGFGLALGLVDLVFHVKIPEPNTGTREVNNKFLKIIIEPLSDEKFGRWMMIMALWTMSVNIGGSFCIPYLIKDLGFENRFVLLTLITVCLVQVSGFISLVFWGRIIDKAGTRKVFLLCYCLWTIIPVFYVFSAFVEPTLLISFAWIIAGVFINGAGIANLAIVSVLTRGKKRSTYLAVMTITSSVAGGLGTLIGSLIVKYFSMWHVFPVSLVARVLSFAVICIVVMRQGIGSISREEINAD
ncbi:MAG: MFS transporter [Planctomycetota bacterium]